VRKGKSDAKVRHEVCRSGRYGRDWSLAFIWCPSHDNCRACGAQCGERQCAAAHARSREHMPACVALLLGLRMVAYMRMDTRRRLRLLRPLSPIGMAALIGEPASVQRHRPKLARRRNCAQEVCSKQPA